MRVLTSKGFTALPKRRIAQRVSFVDKTMRQLAGLEYFFRTMDTELEGVIEAEDLLTRASDPTIPSHEAMVAAKATPLDPEEEAELAMWDDAYEEQYWEELSAKFRPHFYAGVTLMVVAVLEAGLTRLARFLRNKKKLPFPPGQLRGSALEQFRTFAKLARWPVPSNTLWSWAADLYSIRNSLIHEAGSVYAFSEDELETHARNLDAIARKRGGFEVERVFEQAPIAEMFLQAKDEVRTSEKRRQKRKPAQLEGVTLIIHRDFCVSALEKAREILTELYAPLLRDSTGDSRARSRRPGRTDHRP